MKIEYPITGGTVLLDEHMVDRIAGWQWREHGGYARALRWMAVDRSQPRSKRNRKLARVWMHRLIAGVQGMPLPEIDHINGNGLDNRLANLRPVTASQNCMNRRDRADNTSGCPGVHYNQSAGRWVARIGARGERIYLGAFASKAEAAAVRQAAVREHHGTYAMGAGS